MRAQGVLAVLGLALLLCAAGPQLGLIGYPLDGLSGAMSTLVLCLGAVLYRRRPAASIVLELAKALYEGRREEFRRLNITGTASAFLEGPWDDASEYTQERYLREARQLLQRFEIRPR